MKYIAVIDTDDYKDFKFFEDGNGKYIHGIDAGAENNEWIALYFTECEQEPILDKIREEIRGKYRVVLKSTPKDDWAVRWNDCIDEVLQIIDKYKAESEDKE